MRRQSSPVGGKICRRRAPIADSAGALKPRKARFYWVFRHGTDLAELIRRTLVRVMRRCRSSVMLPALTAASAAIDALKSLTSSKSSKSSSATSTGFTQAAANPFDQSGTTQAPTGASTGTGGTGFTQISPQTMSALIDARSQSSTASTTSASTTAAPTDASSALKDLFSQIDANGDGQITKSEFENALGAGGTNIQNADNVFAKLDANGDGSGNLDEMTKALQGAGSKGGHHHHHAASAAGSSDSSNTDGSSAD